MKVNHYIVIFLFAILAAFQFFGESPDYRSYVGVFSDLNDTTKEFGLEPGFEVIRYLNGLLFQSNTFFVYLFVGVFALTLKFRTILKFSRLPGLSILLYLCSFYFLHEYTQIRASVAIAVFFFALVDLKDNRPIVYFAKMAVAICFHYSAILMLPVWIFVRLASQKRAYLFLVVAAFAFSVFNSSFVNILLNALTYLLSLFNLQNKLGGQSGVNSLLPTLISGLHLVLFLAVYKMVDTRPDSVDFFLFKVYSFYLFSFYSLLPVGVPTLTARVPEFTMSILVILLPNLLEKTSHKYLFSLMILFYLGYRSFTILRSVGIL